MLRDNWGKWVMAIALLIIVTAGVFVVIALTTHKTPVSIGGQVVYASVANTDSARVKGLSGTSPLGQNEAMLFIFDTPGRWGMWMKDMKYSLDMVWLDDSKQVVYLTQNVSPDTYPKVFLPDTDARYVIELPAGFIQAHGIAVGQIASFSAN